MDLNTLADEAKKVVGERGGIESVKEDALELERIGKGDGSLADKAKAAVAALQDPGAPGNPPASGAGS